MSAADPTRLGFHGASYRVGPTTPEHAAGLGPLQFSVDGKGFHWQDYFTPDEADLLAGFLRAAARSERQRLDALRSDLECVADAAHTPYTKAEAA